MLIVLILDKISTVNLMIYLRRICAFDHSFVASLLPFIVIVCAILYSIEYAMNELIYYGILLCFGRGYGRSHCCYFKR